MIARLHLDSSAKAPVSVAASHHGDLRRKQGYSVAMVVEESRLLQVCLFSTLHKNTTDLDYEDTAPGRGDHRGRSGCATKTANAALHLRAPG